MADKEGAVMKAYEKASESMSEVPGYLPYVIRGDGNGFSKFTKGLQEPYDLNFSFAMILATLDAMLYFNADTAYTHSDEFTLIFAPKCSKEDWVEQTRGMCKHNRNGRIIKNCTLVASFFSDRFKHHMKHLVNNDAAMYSPETLEKINYGVIMFDARPLVFPEGEAANLIAHHMWWRSIYDCWRNGVSTFADNYIGKRETHGMNIDDKVTALAKVGVNFSKDVPMYYQHGSYIKRVDVEKQAKNHRGESVTCVRTVPKHFTVPYLSKENMNIYSDLFLAKKFEREFEVLMEDFDPSKMKEYQSKPKSKSEPGTN